ERYRTGDYLFGTEPNDFLVETIKRVPTGELLCLADGEGRNGVYLASLGFEVTSIDASAIGIAKAQQLAERKQVDINTIVADLREFDLGAARWDCIVSIFFHMPEDVRRDMHARIERALRPGGHLILEAYTPRQLEFKTGGPPVAEMLMTLEDLRSDFPGMEFLYAEEKEREVIEGKGHVGHAAVVQLFAKKKSAR
ncbi:MAG: class I SAM-dependent methyltransferase, partial [Pseudomonadales bacterium]